ncbi:hypothetical protein D9619_002536 [Psilocybe cf. subviscida]|uniref:Sec20 C-terminal domain-containing protein n=1 Tax=Psilocybe cf. subviscida TaxID=2480587 RepID=A0A8H5AY39_9AGAR|nr:hypothetical protein D9619_002536 [Psilocybe cf. subviscida]
MAPIPSRLHADAVALISTCEGRHNHISKTLITELGACVGPYPVQQRLAEDIRDATAGLCRQIDELEMMVDDQQGEKTRRELWEIVSGFRGKVETLRRDTRAALLASKKAIDSRARSNREELLAFSSTPMEKQTSSEKTTEDALMKANSDVTDALRRTVALMQSELERSVLSTQLLDESTATLRSTSLQHDTLHNVMSISKQLVTALEKSDWMDRVLILSGFVFFILVVLFILKQRIVDRGLRIAFWWTRFIPSFGDDGRLLQEAEKGVASAVAEASSTVVAAAVTVSSTVASVAAEILGSATGTPSDPATPSSSPDDTLPSESIASLESSPSPETSSPTRGTAEQDSSAQASTEHIHIEL